VQNSSAEPQAVDCHVVCNTSIVSNNSPELSYDAVILKNWKKDIKLVLTAIAKYRTKGKEGLLSLEKICSIMCTNCQKKVLIRGGLNIK
jgi:hypothetical protein